MSRLFSPTLLSSLALCAIVGFTSAPAMAQSDEDIAEAGRLYEAGIEAFQADDFAAAIALFEKAYSHDPHPMFLYNISVAYSRQGDVEQAHEMARRIYGDDLLPADTQVRNAARYHGISALMLAESRAEAVANASVAEITQPSGPSFFDNLGVTWMGWTGAGAAATGVTFMIIAGAISSSLDADLDAYEEARLDANEPLMDRLRSDIEGSQATGKFFLYAGTGLAVAGTGLLVYDLVLRDKNEDRPASTARLSGVVTPHSASVGLNLSF